MSKLSDKETGSLKTRIEGSPEPAPDRKGKSPAGRKQGYKMQGWQKELQLTSIRNRDLENFNHFLIGFIETLQDFKGEEFYMVHDGLQKDPLAPPERIFILKDILRRRGGLYCNTLFLYQNVTMSWERICLKAFDNYTLVRDRKLFPLSADSRSRMHGRLNRLAMLHQQNFPEGDQASAKPGGRPD